MNAVCKGTPFAVGNISASSRSSCVETYWKVYTSMFYAIIFTKGNILATSGSLLRTFEYLYYII